jgi:xylulokinase
MILGLDLGTGSVKALVFHPDGSSATTASAPYRVHAPRPDRAEADPGEWWDAVVGAVREATGERGAEVEAVGLSGQMHGVVLVDSNANPLRPAILWADTRSVRELDRYKTLDEAALGRLANPPATGMAGPSLLWLREDEPGVYNSARWALQPKDWLRMRLTGKVHAEPSDASATLLYDVGGDRWDVEVVESLSLDAELLAPLVPSASPAGALSAAAADALGLRAGIPVAAGGADTAVALLGTGSIEPGAVQLTVGTGAQVVGPRDDFSPDPYGRTHLFRTVWDRDGAASGTRFYAMAAIQNAGLALEWVLGVLGMTWEDADREAFEIAPGADGLTFVPYLSGERTPVFDPGARGAWTGMGLGHTRAHLLRAALEGVAFAVRDGVEALEAAGVEVPELRLAGGGAVGEAWRRMLADVLGKPLLPLPDGVARVASARGAALLGGLAAGTLGASDLPRPRTEDPILPSASAEYGAARARYREMRDRASRA